MKFILFDNAYYSNFTTYLNKKFHSKNFPAVVFTNRTQTWWLGGKLHNSYGPARVCIKKYNEYYLCGAIYTKEQWEIERKKYL